MTRTSDTLSAARACAVLLVTGVLAAGCGTTVPGAGQAQGQGRGLQAGVDQPLDQGVGQPGSTAAGGDANGLGASVPGGAAPVGTTGQPGSSAAPAGGNASVVRPGTASGAASPGAPVEVGIAYAKNADQFGGSLGKALDLGDGRAQNDALVSYINKNGGLAGHPIKPVYYEVDLARTEPWSVFVQEACSLWTEDHRVIAASFPVNIDIGQLAACLTKHGAVLDASSLRLRSQRDYNTSPQLVEPWMITVERLAPLYVRGLQQQGYFSGNPTLGLLSYDYPQARLFAKLISEELRKIGHPVKTTFEAHYADSTSGLGSTIAEVQSSILKFRSDGVTHVMSAAIPGGIGVAFQPAASSQGYYPRYGLTSFDAITDMPDDQATNALAVGWWLHDTDRAHEIGNAATKLCRSIFRANGSANTRSQEYLSFVYCDFMLWMHHVGTDVARTTRLDGGALVRLLDSAGPSYASPRTLGTALRSARRDGATGLRGLRFDLPCSCWVYGRAVQ